MPVCTPALSTCEGKDGFGHTLPGGNSPIFSAAAVDSRALRERGYNIGQNIAVDCRSFSPERDNLVREIARNLVRENVDVIVTPGTQVTRAVQQKTSSIPIVMVAVGDPVGVALVASLARPGGNITGLINMSGCCR